MKKIFFLLMLTLFATVMVACGDDDKDDLEYSFSLTVDNVSELRESISIDITLTDEANELENSEVRGKITKVGATSAFSDKKITFGEDETSKEVNFTKLTADTEYVVVFYASYEETTVDLATLNVKTSNQGTEEAPYLIDSYDDFKNIVAKDRTAYFKMANDIDFNGQKISPLFTSSSAFTGNFDGAGYTIKNFKVSDGLDQDGNSTYVKTSTQNYGLFGYISTSGKISNLKLDSFNVFVHYTSTSKAGNFGLLAGYNAGTIENVTVTNSSLNVKATAKTQKYLNVGGLVGNLSSKGTISNVSVSADINVTGPIDATVGGVCGTTVNAEIITKDGANVANLSKAVFDGNIKVEINGANSYDAYTTVGGVLGRNYTAVVDEIESKGTINVTTAYTTVANPSIIVGGLVGWNISHSGVVSNSTSSVIYNITTYDVPAEEKKLVVYGGLIVGRNGGGSPSYAEVKNCTYTSTEENKINVIGNTRVEVKAGIVAHEVSEGNVYDCTADSNATILVQNYQIDSETKNPVTDGEAIKVQLN